MHMSEQDDTRKRLLKAATEVFAEHGYHAATTREICRRANANLAAIHYHFGDKAELYREVFKLPFLEQSASLGEPPQQAQSLAAALKLFYRILLQPAFEDGERMRQITRLRAREEIESSGVLGDAVAQVIRPNFDRLLQLLCRELGAQAPDKEIERLAFCLIGMARIFIQGECVVNAFSPQLLQGGKAFDEMIAKLVIYATNLIETEAALRHP
jgi:TetR/AcrR family transcriptional regulator, regulator of cefoperazone and chloramphenicol sensitivity